MSYGYPPQAPPQRYPYFAPAQAAAAPLPTAYPPPPAPTYLAPAVPTDPYAFRQFYAAQLAALTSNQKNIITNLTVLAQEHARLMSGEIAVAIEDCLRRTPPQHRLPPLYLLDSISKNCPPPSYPYTNLFSRFIAAIFLETYAGVDGSMRAKLEELVVTWHNGGPYGREVFGPEVQRLCEERLYGRAGWQPQPAGPDMHVVLREIQDLLEQRRAMAYRMPGDAEAQAQIGALQNLERIILSTSVPPAQLAEIHDRVKSLKAQSFAPPLPAPRYPPPPSSRYATPPFPPQGASTPPFRTATPPFRPPPPPSHAPVYRPPAPAPTDPFYATNDDSPQVDWSTPPPSTRLANASPVRPPPPPPPPQAFPPVSTLQREGTPTSVPVPPPVAGSAQAPSSVPPPAPAPAPAAAVAAAPDIGALLANLQKSGLLGAASAPTPPLTTVTEEKKPEDEADAAERAYDDAILSLDIKLDNSDILKRRTHADDILRDRLPVQCPQCARRFPEGPAGRAQLQEHIDSHFRANRRAKEGTRGLTRSWFVGTEDWISDTSDGSGSRSGLPINRREAQAAEAANTRNALAAQSVPVPSDPEEAARTCPICKEKFRSEFDEDAEEWVWRNAVEVDGVIYHATCHEDAKSATLSGKLLEAVAVASRGTTPARDVTPRSPPVKQVEVSLTVLGKREHEDDDDSANKKPAL